MRRNWKGIGAILMQKGRPLAYFSKGLSEANLAKSTYEKELMALVLAIQHWRPYLLGRKFQVLTDQKALRHLLEQRITTPGQQNWLAKLLGYDMKVIYKPGTLNGAADALSRVPEYAELRALSKPVWLDQEEIQAEVLRDQALRRIMEELTCCPASITPYELVQGRLFYKGRLVIPSESQWVTRLLHEGHQTPTGGHSGAYRTYRRIADNVYWIGMKKDIYQWVAACQVCQRQKYQALALAGLLQPLPIPNLPWEDIAMDFTTRFPKSRGVDAILVVVDRLSKYRHFLAIRHPFSARSVAELFVKEIVKLHGVPRSIVSDRDPMFISVFWSKLFKLLVLNMSSSYHPETDGQTEVLNRCLETYLRCYAFE